MNWIPKIRYTKIATGGVTEFTFDHEPESDPFNEEYEFIRKSTRSENGTMETEHSYNIKRYKLEFKFMSETTKDNVVNWITDDASHGNTFSYYPSSDESDYETMEYVDNSFKLSRPIPDGAGDFEYDFEFEIERVDDASNETPGVIDGGFADSTYWDEG